MASYDGMTPNPVVIMGIAGTLLLLNNASATGDPIAWPGGQGTVSISGTFGGATATLQYLAPDGSTWVDAGPDAVFTAAGAVNFEAAAGSIRMFIAGGPPSGLNATIKGFGA